ncbi:Sulfide:quinone oxidoreductase, Type II [hydrothermal vent metagenome]|uniref:Sulfide:quinone oxidoreductase, Type II n=1 Tax=hydrothermal vent metagenome TaxID=652676 RepID=A0A3B0SEU0_9ZZZZ
MTGTAEKFDVVIVGGGSGGIATASSLLKRRPNLSIAIVEPSENHYYQPGWTMVGGGVFDAKTTERPTSSVIPRNAKWIKAAAKSFQPQDNRVTLEDNVELQYDILVVAPGISLDWAQIDGLEETLGKNGVTSNYRFDLAPYTYELVKNLKSGTALFTQPPMPIKCAGAPQKAMYLSCDNWLESGDLSAINVEFHNAGGVIFGVDAYVPALMEYVERYAIDLNFGSNLVAVDGANKKAIFETPSGHVEKSFDMLHVCPPQVAPKFIAESPLTAKNGYVDVDKETMQHVRFPNIFGLGDGSTTPNAKTMAAARKQAPIVAVNALAVLDQKDPNIAYDGYGSCPLTVEKGKIVLAEFGYGGKLLPSFPHWLIDGTRPARLSWLLKSEALPWIYWNGMLKGREWLVKPDQKITR